MTESDKIEKHLRRVYKGLSKDAIEKGKEGISEDKFLIISLKREIDKLHKIKKVTEPRPLNI